ncbi:response regulator, partial [Chloroflexota bacterium]
GKELMRELRRATPDLKILGITGYVLVEAMQELKDAGFLEIIQKPFEIKSLAQVIRRALDVS